MEKHISDITTVVVTPTITTDTIKAVMEPDIEIEITNNSVVNMINKDESNRAINLYIDSV